MMKLTTSQTGNTIHAFGWLNCSRQMYQPIKTENAKPSTRLKTRKVPLVNIRGSIWRETIITPTPRHRLTLHHLMSRQVTRLRAKMSEAGYYGWHKRIEF